MTIASNYPNFKTALLLDFVNCQKLDPRITFTRASTARYYDGKTTVLAEQNLQIYSQDFTQSVWQKNGALVTGNSTTAPDGTTTANLVTMNATAAPAEIHSSSISVPANTVVTSSIYLKTGTNQYASVAFTDYNYVSYIVATFDLVNGTVTKTGVLNGTLNASSITSVGNGWYRCAITGFLTTTFSAMGILISLNDTGTPTYGLYSRQTVTGTTATIYAWGAQVEQRSTATPYTVTLASPVTNYVPQQQIATTNTARLDYNPVTGESLGLLIEPQSTNLILQSEVFTSSPWDQVVGATATVIPSGWNFGFNVGQVTATTANGGIRQSIGGLTGGQVYTLSFYLQSTLTNIFLFTENGAAAYGTQCNVTINAVTGATSSMSGFTGVTSTALGNGRVYQVTLPAVSAGSYLSANLEWKTATTGVPFYIGRPQFEASVFATSYIPTAASQATRSGDNALMTGTNFSSWFTPGQGSLYLETDATTISQYNTYIALLDSNSNNYIAISNVSVTPVNRIFIPVIVNGVTILQPSGAIFTGFTKSGISFQTGSFSFVQTGTIYSNAVSLPVVPLNLTQMYIGKSVAGGGTSMSGHIKKIAYYPEALPATNLQSLTAG